MLLHSLENKVFRVAADRESTTLPIVSWKSWLTMQPPQDSSSLGPKCTPGTTEHDSGCSQENNSFGLWVMALDLRVPPRMQTSMVNFQVKFTSCEWPGNHLSVTFVTKPTTYHLRNTYSLVHYSISWLQGYAIYRCRLFRYTDCMSTAIHWNL